VTAPGPLCSICAHPKRKEIELAIVAGPRSQSEIAQAYDSSRQAIMRHRDSHITKDIKRALSDNAEEARSLERGGSILEQMAAVTAEARLALRQAKEIGDLRLIGPEIDRVGAMLERHRPSCRA
jgi:hypothetical protein